MSPESSPISAHTTLGQRLHALRIAQNLTIEEVCKRLKLSTAVVQAMEHDEHAVHGAAVYARGRLISYAHLLGLPSFAVDEQLARNPTIVTQPLISTTHGSRFERVLKRVARQGIYVALTATIVLPVVWLATHDRLPQATASLTTLDPLQTLAGNKVLVPTAHEARHAAPHTEPPIAASMTPFGNFHAYDQPAGNPTSAQPTTAGESASAVPAVITDALDTGLQLRFSGDSWVDLEAADGRVIERGMIEAGTVRNYPAGMVANVTIGNASSVVVLLNGQPFDPAQFQRANIERFTLSSDGKPAAAGN
ncbi:MAG: RodZ domain-containing protein [Lysobacteraceae bacterium]